jgi:trehalose 6-phosphate phosphatase
MTVQEPVGIAAPPANPEDLQGEIALFLDLDGTLAPIADTPSAVSPDPRRTELLARLSARLGGRVAIVSGRTLEEVDRIVEGAVTAAAGVHGLERRTAEGERLSLPAHPALSVARERLLTAARSMDGLLVEDKRLGVALHYRAAPGAADMVRALGRRLASETGLVLQEGHMVVELRTPGPDKGDAVAAFMAEAPFKGAVPVFVGDDATDEHGFAVAAAEGGCGVLVGPARPTAARFRLEDVEAVIAWLEAYVTTPPSRANPEARA